MRREQCKHDGSGGDKGKGGGRGGEDNIEERGEEGSG